MVRQFALANPPHFFWCIRSGIVQNLMALTLADDRPHVNRRPGCIGEVCFANLFL